MAPSATSSSMTSTRRRGRTSMTVTGGENSNADASGNANMSRKRIEVYSESVNEPSPVLPILTRFNGDQVPAQRSSMNRTNGGDDFDDHSDEEHVDAGVDGAEEDGEGEDDFDHERDDEEDDGEYLVEERAHAPTYHQSQRPEFAYPSSSVLQTPSRRSNPPNGNGQSSSGSPQRLTPRSAAAAGLMDKVVGSSRNSPSGRRVISGGSASGSREEGSPSRGGQVPAPPQGRKALVTRRPSGSNAIEGMGQPNTAGSPGIGKKSSARVRSKIPNSASQGGYAIPPQPPHGMEMAHQHGQQHLWYGQPQYLHPHQQGQHLGQGYAMQHYPGYPTQQYPPHHAYQSYQQYPPQPQQRPHDRAEEVNLMYGEGGYAMAEERQQGYLYSSHPQMQHPQHAGPQPPRSGHHQPSPSPHLTNVKPSPSPLLVHTELGKSHFVPPQASREQEPQAPPAARHAVGMSRSYTSESYMSHEEAQMMHQAEAAATGTIALEHISGRDDAFKTPAGKMIGRIGGSHGHGVGMMNGLDFSSPLDDVSTYQSERSASKTMSTPSTARRALGDAYADTPTRSMTPVSAYSGTESSYQPSTTSARKLKKAYIPSSSVAGDDDLEMDDGEEVDDEEDDYRDGQSSPTRAGKGRGLRSSAALRRGAAKPAAQDGSTGKRKGASKGDAKARDAARKVAAAQEAKPSAAATQQAKEEYVPENIPPGPRSVEKPPYSYAGLIGQAIKSSSKKKLALHQIYAWILTAYPFFQKDEAGWQNSIRHNLSLNECFIKSDREIDEMGGKGSYWMIEPGAEFQFQNGGFKKHQRTLKDKGTVDGLILGPGGKSTKSKKRKLGELEAGGTESSQPQAMQMMESTEQSSPGEMTDRLSSNTPNLDHSVPRLSEYDHHLSDVHGPPNTEDAMALGKRPKLEKSMTWTAAEALGHEVPRPSSAPGMTRHLSHPPMPSQGEANDFDLFQAQHGAKFRRSVDQETTFSVPPSQLIVPRHSMMEPGHVYQMLPPQYAPESSPFPGPHLDQHAVRPKRMTRFELEDSYETPQKVAFAPGHGQHIPSSGQSYGMLPPHMTPSASSPATSPSQMAYPMDSSAAHLARAYHVGHYTEDDVRRDVHIAGDDRDMDHEYRSNEFQVKQDREKQLQPAAQLGGSFTFATPALPAKARPQAHAGPPSPSRLAQVDSIKSESFILSPMRKGHMKKHSVTSLPGPGALLSNPSQRPVNTDRVEPNGDLLAHLVDRVPGSPAARGASGSLNGFATPLNKSARARLITAEDGEGSPLRAGIKTPIRQLAAFDHFHVTPAGNSRAQFKAEHGLLESPMGAFGSCYDMSDSGARFDWELQQMTGKHRRTASRGDDLVEDAMHTPFSVLGTVFARKRMSNVRGNEEDDEDAERSMLASPTGAGRKKVYNGKALFVGGSP